MESFIRAWFDCSKDVLEQHENIKIRQRYCFIFTADKCVVIVSKDGKEWQFPGGHPKVGENWQKTLEREIYEETGLEIKALLDNVVKLGYYLIEKNEEKFLQERYVLALASTSAYLKFQPQEEAEDTDKIKYVEAVPISEIEKYVPWAPGVKGWLNAVN